MKRRLCYLTILKILKKRQDAFLKSLLHIPPLAITAMIVSLNFRNIFWRLPSDTNTVLNSLQFAVQFHAALITASLSAMLLQLVQRGLIGKHGVPLGFISSSFQLGSVAYLFRKEFTSLNFKYIILFPCILALAALAGPSSAIVMIPRLQFWSIRNIWVAKGEMAFSVYIEANQTTLYPETLTAENVAPQCLGSNASIVLGCPSYGIRQWVLDEELFAFGDNLDAPSINKTVQGDWIRYLTGKGPTMYQGMQSSYTSSSLSNFLGTSLIAYDRLLSGFSADTFGVNSPNTIQLLVTDLRARYDLSFRSAGKEIPTRQPVVQAECVGYAANSTSFTLPYDQMTWLSLSRPISSTELSVPSSRYSNLSIDLNATVINSSWIDISQFGAVKPSLGAIFATPEIYHSQVVYTDPTEPFSFFTCTLDARWMETSAYLEFAAKMEAGAMPIIYDSNPNPERSSNLSTVYIDKSWADLLNGPWIDSLANPEPTNRTILDIIGQKCFDKNTFLNATFGNKTFDGGPRRISKSLMPLLQCLQTSLSVYLTDALARAQDLVPAYLVAEGHVEPYSPDEFPSDVYRVLNLYDSDSQYLTRKGPYVNITKEDFKNPGRFIEMHMPMRVWGYGYGFQDSKLLYVGTTILLLHAALCISYIVWTISTGTSRIEQWETLGELLVMAMRSGGMKDLGDEKMNYKQLWKERFYVRDTAGEAGTSLSSAAGDVSWRGTAVFKRAADYGIKEGALTGHD